MKMRRVIAFFLAAVLFAYPILQPAALYALESQLDGVAQFGSTDQDTTQGNAPSARFPAARNRQAMGTSLVKTATAPLLLLAILVLLMTPTEARFPVQPMSSRTLASRGTPLLLHRMNLLKMSFPF